MNCDKLAAVCTDAAAVMTGCRQLGEDLVGVSWGITAHRLALAASDAARSVEQVKKFQLTIN